MTSRSDIFKKDKGNSFLRVEGVKNMSEAQKRLISLTACAPANYRLFDQSLQQFVNLFNEAA